MSLKTSDLRNLTKDELDLKVSGLKSELYNLRYQVKLGRVEKPHKIADLKRDIARIYTLLREGELKNAAESRKA